MGQFMKMKGANKAGGNGAKQAVEEGVKTKVPPTCWNLFKALARKKFFSLGDRGVFNKLDFKKLLGYSKSGFFCPKRLIMNEILTRIASMISPDLPLIDLHRHLEGNIRLETILDLGRQFNVRLPAQTAQALRPFACVNGQQAGVMAFIEKFSLPMSVLGSEDACRRIAVEAVEDAAAEGIDYLELRFSPLFMAEAHRLDPAGVVAAVADGIRAASAQCGLPVKLLGIISRTYGPQTANRELSALLTCAADIVGLDLAGDEANYPAELFNEHFEKAMETGWKITVHAGEADGPQSIWKSIQILGAERIGHGLSAIQDEALMDWMFERQIGIECNLTSNVQTRSVADYASHPLRTFLQNGLLASINSDDPGISGIDLPYEYNTAAPLAGLSEKQIRQAQLNALESAFLTPKEKVALINKKKNY
jgi:adenosine deaminase